MRTKNNRHVINGVGIRHRESQDNFRYDVMIVDRMIPKIDGLCVVELLRVAAPAWTGPGVLDLSRSWQSDASATNRTETWRNTSSPKTPKE